MSLNLIDEHAQFGKMTNNVETHGDEPVPGCFAVPVVLMLKPDQLEGLMGKYFSRSLYNTDAATQLMSPVDGFRRIKPLQLEDVYEDVTVRIGERAGADVVRKEEFRGSKFSKIQFELTVGGMTKTDGQIYVHAGLGDRNLWLQKLQNHEIQIEIVDGKIAAKKNPAQQQLPLQQGNEPAPQSAGQDSNEASRIPEHDAEIDRQIGRPPAFVSAGGAAVDERMRAAHGERPTVDYYSNTPEGRTLAQELGVDVSQWDSLPAGSRVEVRDGVTQLTAKDLQAFEEGVRNELQTFERLPNGVIDGRSERVKHQDEQREGEAA